MKIFKKDLILQTGISALIATILICWQMRIWELDMTVLPDTGGDVLLGIMQLRSMKESGLRGIWINTRLGAPDVSALVDCPFLDFPMTILGYIFTKIFHSETIAFYLLYIVTYPLAAAAMCFLMNNLTNKGGINILIAVLYAVAPYHFLRGMHHMTLSFYYVIPLGIYFALKVAEEDFSGCFPQKFSHKVSAKMYWCFFVFLIGISNIYYSFFCMMMVIISIIYKILLKKNWKIIIHEGFVFYEMAGAFLIGILPKIIFSLKYGWNEKAGARFPWDTEIYGLKIIQLFLPPSYTKRPFLQKIYQRYVENGFDINENQLACLGLVGCLGFIFMCVWIISKIILENKHNTREDAIITLFSLYTLVLVLYCTIGGFGAIFSYFVTPELRSLNRVSICIEALAMAAMTIYLVKTLDRRMNIALMSVLCLLSFYADFPPITSQGVQSSMKEHASICTDFFSTIEKQVGDGSMIYELPIAEFPEYPPVYNMTDYSLLRGYLYTNTIRWSYGGVKGRNDAAKELYTDEGMSQQFVDGLLNNGFSGIYVDTDGFEDGGMAINEFYQKQLGIEPIVSKDGKMLFYNIENLSIPKS